MHYFPWDMESKRPGRSLIYNAYTERASQDFYILSLRPSLCYHGYSHERVSTRSFRVHLYWPFIDIPEYVEVPLKILQRALNIFQAQTCSFLDSKKLYLLQHSRLCRPIPRRGMVESSCRVYGNQFAIFRRTWETRILETLNRRPNKKCDYVQLRSEQVTFEKVVFGGFSNLSVQ